MHAGSKSGGQTEITTDITKVMTPIEQKMQLYRNTTKN